MLTAILKAISGAFGPYIIYASLAAISGLSLFAGVEAYRLNSLKADYAHEQAAHQICEANVVTLKAGIAQANADVDAAKAAAAKAQSDAAAAAKRRLATPHVPVAPGADNFNRWLETKP